MQSDVSIYPISARSVAACCNRNAVRSGGTKEPRRTAGVMAGTSQQPSDALEAARCISTHGLCKWAVLGICLLMKRGAAWRNWTVNSQI